MDITKLIHSIKNTDNNKGVTTISTGTVELSDVEVGFYDVKALNPTTKISIDFKINDAETLSMIVMFNSNSVVRSFAIFQNDRIGQAWSYNNDVKDKFQKFDADKYIFDDGDNIVTVYQLITTFFDGRDYQFIESK